MNSEEKLVKIIKEWCSSNYCDSLVVFFKQKHKDEVIYIDVTVLASYDYDTDIVTFDWDFCEGETDIKDVKIYSLRQVLNYFKDNYKPNII